jgi:hypothetical protein
MDIPNNDDGNLQYRAALVSIGVLYEDYHGPLSPELIASAEAVIAERKARGQAPAKSRE